MNRTERVMTIDVRLQDPVAGAGDPGDPSRDSTSPTRRRSGGRPGPHGPGTLVIAPSGPVPVRIRPFRIDDGVAVRALFDRLSDRSTFLRFFSLSRRAGLGYADALADPDRTLFAAVAVDEAGTVFGVGSLHRITAGRAEFGLTVDDRAQGRGIGTRLLVAVLQDAYRRRLTDLVAYVQSDNQPMLQVIAAELPDATYGLQDGVVVATVPVDAAVHHPATHLALAARA